MARPDRTAIIATSILAIAAVACDFLSRQMDDARAGHAHALYLLQVHLAKSEGIPLTLAELVKPVPLADDAAPLYLAASKEFTALHTNPYPVLLNPVKTAEVRKLLAKAAPGLALLDKAVALPDCDLAKKPPSLFDFPDVARVKFMAKMAVCQAELQARDGHPVEALDSLARRAMICTHLAQAPSVIAAIQYCSAKMIFQSSIARILDGFGRQTGVAEAGQRALEALGPAPDLVKVEAGQLLFQLDLMTPKGLTLKPGEHAVEHDLSPPDPQFAEVANATRLGARPGMIDRWRAIQVELARTTVAAIRKGPTAPLVLENHLNMISNAATSSKNDDHAWARLGGSINGLADSVDLLVCCESMNRVLLQACATFEHMNASGKVPGSLVHDGSFSRDPFTGKPLHFSSTATGFKIYGVGAHGVDHGGLPRGAVDSGDKCDLVFEYHPLSSRTAGHTAFNSELKPANR